ncbi:hypothetical protein HJ590_01130 [Naumannella sp. ID2617S]|nr:hypothetical protein [Naumannella sp. ID2617S]
MAARSPCRSSTRSGRRCSRPESWSACTPPMTARPATSTSGAAFLGASVLPHEGLGLSRAHRDISTGVLSHTVFFHRPFDPSEWALYNVQSTFTGAGRAFGRAEVFGGGQLIASITQESMLRPLTGGVL